MASLANNSDGAVRAILELIRNKLDRRVVGTLVGCIAAKLVWSQYRVLLCRNLPAYRFEFPLIGGNLGIFWHGYIPWARKIALGGHQAVLSSLFGSNAVVVSWKVYNDFVKKADNEGKLDQGDIPQYMKNLIGLNSLLFMKAGKGQHHHHRLRSKILASMTPKRILALVPLMVEVVREELDQMVQETSSKGFSTFQKRASNIATRISGLPIVGTLPPQQRQEIDDLFMVWIKGLFALPVNCGSLSSFGRAMQARAKLVEIIKGLMHDSPVGGGDHVSVISELAASDAAGSSFTDVEITDSIFTLLFAGQFTTSETLPCLLVELSTRADWRAKVAEEPLEFVSMEADSATVRFIREVARMYPPEVMFVRKNTDSPLELGEQGTIPRGCNVFVNFGHHMWAMGEDFNPDRWLDPAADRENFLTFGGHSPHSCVGRSVAMLEMQIFARLVARDYEVEVLDASRVRNWELGGITHKYRDGCKVKVTKRHA